MAQGLRSSELVPREASDSNAFSLLLVDMASKHSPRQYSPTHTQREKEKAEEEEEQVRSVVRA